MLEWMVPAFVLAVIDGDTAKVRAQVWLGMTVEVAVRVEGIDTPEKGWRAKCPTEAALGEQATTLAKMMFEGKDVLLVLPKEDKYGGRVVAKVVSKDGTDWRETLIVSGLAKPYDGGTKESWCQ